MDRQPQKHTGHTGDGKINEYGWVFRMAAALPFSIFPLAGANHPRKLPPTLHTRRKMMKQFLRP